MKRSTLLRAGLALPLMLAASGALAQTYPDKPVKLLVPFAPGGTTDIIARIVALNIAPHFNGQTMIVENKGGAGGALGANETARAAPDGYSLGMATVSTVATVPAIQPSTPYNPLTDFTPITNIAATPNVIAIHPSFPAKDFAGFVEELRKNPGKYSYASSGTGGIAHLNMEFFRSLTKTDIKHVPYRGSGPALNDAIAGHVPVIMDNLPSSLQHILSGKLIAIAVAAPGRAAALPNVPTLTELGYPALNRVAFYGIYGPKGLPPAVVERVHAAVKKTLENPEVRKRIEETGSLILGNSPAEFAAEIKNEFETYKKVVDEQKLKPE